MLDRALRTSQTFTPDCNSRSPKFFFHLYMSSGTKSFQIRRTVRKLALMHLRCFVNIRGKHGVSGTRGAFREMKSRKTTLPMEFQKTGGLVDVLYQLGLGRPPTYDKFMLDTRSVARDIVVGQTSWEAKLTLSKRSFVTEFVQRAVFRGPFVRRQYFGYLRRYPDPDGYQFWLNQAQPVQRKF